MRAVEHVCVYVCHASRAEWPASLKHHFFRLLSPLTDFSLSVYLCTAQEKHGLII